MPNGNVPGMLRGVLPSKLGVGMDGTAARDTEYMLKSLLQNFSVENGL